MSDFNEDSSALMQSAKATALLLGVAVRAIDARLGDGYAASNPQLAGLFVLSAMVDFHASELSGVLGSMADAQQGMAEALDCMATQSGNPATPE